MNETVSAPASPIGGTGWRDRRRAFGLYLAFSAIGHLVWEVLQLPLYGLWQTSSPGELAFAVGHCTAGDVLIAASVLVLALLICRARAWPKAGTLVVAVTAIVLGVGYTAFSEWLNVYVRGSWSYAPSMPILRVAGYDIGLAPLAQWIVIPLAVFAAVGRSRSIARLR